MFYVLTLAVIVASVSGSPVREGRHPVLVLSFDGVGADVAKNLSSWTTFKSKAASPDYVKSVFPTKTFSTHFSVATGVKPSVHGVIGNVQFDKNDKKVHNHPNQYRYVEDILPIWIENEKQGGNSGTMMWPGAQFKYGGKVIDSAKEFNSRYTDDGNDEDDEEDGSQNDDDNYNDGLRADYHVDYNPKSLDWNKRADKIIEWLTLDENPANLVLAYFEDFGSIDPAKKEEEKKKHIGQVDDILKYIHEGLVEKKLNDKVDIIIVSDHGTHPTEGKDILIIDDILDIKDEQNNIISSGPLAYISPEKDEYEKAIEQLNSQSDNGSKYKIYKKSDLKWGLDDLEVLDNIITVVANPPYTFYTQQNLDKIQEKYNLKKENIVQDVNGYDNEEKSMNGLFYGVGPSFKDDVHLEGEHFDLDEVYPLIKVLIGLPLQNSSSVQNNNDLDPVVQKLLEPTVLK